jgi:carboxyl-terminal processing protease
MNHRRYPLLLAMMPTVALLFCLGGGAAGFFLGMRRGPGDEFAKVRVALDRIQEHYVTDYPPGKLADLAIEGVLAKLDPYCEYFTAQEYKEFREQVMEGKFGGVGVVVGSDKGSGYLVVETPVEDSPAFEADILPGDVIREVDGKTIKGLMLQEVVRKIRGEPGTEVTLTLARKGRDPFQVKLLRKVITVKAIKAKLLEGGIGYIRISDFTEMMPQFDADAKKLIDQGIQGLVIDLRFNGGGLLTECVKLADRFLDEGIIVTTEGRNREDTRKFEAHKDDTLPNFPLVVLVNEGTASASEIFAGAMKDHKRGILVGTRTFGKGSVQTPFGLPDGSHIKITTARYYTPNHISVHREEGKKDYGLDPDYRIEMSQEEYGQLMKKWNAERILKGEKPGELEKVVDYQLQAGLEVLRAKIEHREPKVEPRLLKKDKPSEN